MRELSGLAKKGLMAALFILPGCATLAPDPYLAADRLAEAHDFSKRYLDTGAFRLLSYQRLAAPDQTVNIYLEGDGAAWQTRTRLASDPTPRQQLVLELAALDPAAKVVYLARPCQYVIREGMGGGCGPDLWSSARFGEETVAGVDRAIDLILAATKASRLNLIGYSGGGALAVLVAARREDVVSLRTIAGNLDHRKFTSYHRISPLSDSLNPIDVATAVERIPQLHFVGEEDDIVPGVITEGFLARQTPDRCAEMVRVEGVRHHQGWPTAWPELLSRPLPCSSSAGL